MVGEAIGSTLGVALAGHLLASGNLDSLYALFAVVALFIVVAAVIMTLICSCSHELRRRRLKRRRLRLPRIEVPQSMPMSQSTPKASAQGNAPFHIADEYVKATASLDTTQATYMGVSASHKLTDHSPDGIEARVDLARRTLVEMAHAPVKSDRERICRDFILERLGVVVALHEAGENWRSLRLYEFPIQTIRQTFELAPRETIDDWHRLAAWMKLVPQALDGYVSSLNLGLARGLPAARRQALLCAQQATAISGIRSTGRAYFPALADACPFESARAALEEGALMASDAYAALAIYLRQDYAPVAPEYDPVGRERYALAVRDFIGIDAIDLEDTYAWGWDELHEIQTRMAAVAHQVLPGSSLAAAVHLLRTDPGRGIAGAANYIQFLQELTDRAISTLDSVHFDIPEAIRRCEVVPAPVGGGAAMYYTPPSEDLSRPGRIWCPTTGRTTFPLWAEVTTAYHEGVPGHHLQIGLVHCLHEDLSRYQRLLGWVSGHGEGWALYAERLMGELGCFDVPDYELGMLFAQALRAVRVIVDIGLHLQLPIPRGSEGAGQVWSRELAIPYIDRYARYPGAFAESEADRYLGMPAQAISYKIGERTWLSIRNTLKVAQGADFNLRRFHTRALNLGPLGLDLLRRELAGAGSMEANFRATADVTDTSEPSLRGEP